MLKIDCPAKICAIESNASLYSRMSELGFYPGRNVIKRYESRKNTIACYDILGSRIALRHDEASKVMVEPICDKA